MRGVRFVLALVLLLVLTGVPATLPAGVISGPRLVGSNGGWLDVARASNGNRDDNTDNDGEDGGKDNKDDDGDDNDGDDDDSHLPRSRPVPPAAPPPPPPLIERASLCANPGDTLTITWSVGAATVKAFASGTQIELARADLPGVPLPIEVAQIGPFVFRLSASTCGGGTLPALPNEVNLGVGYAPELAYGRNPATLTLYYFDGQAWSEAPKLANDASNRYVSASVTGTGIYVLVQR
jgi:hypothetical protein